MPDDGEAEKALLAVPAPSGERHAEETVHSLNRLMGYARVVTCCVLYLAIGPTLILVNRTILKEKDFKYPMALSGLGLLFSSAVSTALVFGKCVTLHNKDIVTYRFFFFNMVPIGAASATTLAAGNAVYMYLPVGFIQMLKAFTPVVTLFLVWLSGIEVPSRRVVLTVLGICSGTALASLGEGSLNLIGIGLMLLAEVAEAIKVVLTQRLLQNLKFGVIEGQYFLAPISALWLFSAAGVSELPRALRKDAYLIPMHQPLIFLLSAALGFAVHLVTFLVIKTTNSVTLKVLGTARNAGLILVSAWLYAEQITPLEAFGYAISLVCFGLYNHAKMKGL